MIRVFLEEKKGKYKIIAACNHQKDLNNLRLMSYRLKGADKVMLNKDKYEGPYLVLDCDEYLDQNGNYNLEALKQRVEELNQQYN